MFQNISDKTSNTNENKDTKQKQEDVYLNCIYKKNINLIQEYNNMHESNQEEQLTQQDKNNFKLIAKEIMFDVKIVKCKWEEEDAVMVLLSDISQKVAIDRMRQVNQYKNELLASITHNLKTPLNGVMLMIESAIVSNSLNFIQKKLMMAQNSGRLLLYMINDLLDYSRLNSNKHFQLSIQQFRLDDLISNIRSLLINQFEAKNIQLEFIIAVNEVHQIFFNDQLRIEQVLLNLCLNALKFTFKGYVKIYVFEDETRNNEIFFTVSDSGLGISEQYKQRLFKCNSVNQNHNERSKRHGIFQFYFIFIKYDCYFEGVGLGLSVCQKLICELGSEKNISMQSQQGKGTSFTFSVYRKHPVNQNDKLSFPKFKTLRGIQFRKRISIKIDQNKEVKESPIILPSIEVILLKARRNSLTIRKPSLNSEKERYLSNKVQNRKENEGGSSLESETFHSNNIICDINSSSQMIPMSLQSQRFKLPHRKLIERLQSNRNDSIDLKQIEDEENQILSEKKQIICIPQIQIKSHFQTYSVGEKQLSKDLTDEPILQNQTNSDYINNISDIESKQGQSKHPSHFSMYHKHQQQFSTQVQTKQSEIITFKEPFNNPDKNSEQFGEFKMANSICLANQKNLVERMNQLIWRKTKLLIVDDTTFNVLAIKILLQSIPNLIIDEAYNGQQAVQKVKESKDFQLIFMDINMPVLDGFQATCQINKLMQKKLIPLTTIIMVSAFNDQVDRKKSFGCGAKAHIDKPVSLQSIFDTLQILNIPHLKIENQKLI